MNIGKLKNYLEARYRSEVSPMYTYHTWDHTLYVLKVCNQYIRRYKLSKEDAYILRTGALVHDLGFLWNHKNHESQGVKFINEELPKWGYTQKQIRIIDSLIESTQIPQKPKTLMEKIICDSDLDYLGTDLFYSVGETLYQEFLACDVVKNRKEWNELQIKFLQNHSYHTDFAKKYRAPVKEKYLQELIKNHS